MIASLFLRSKRTGQEAEKNWFSVLEPRQLLSTHEGLIAAIRAMVGVPDRHWQTLYQPMLNAYAGMVQRLPASEAHHHAGPGGLLLHGLDVAHEALKLRRSSLLPTGAAAEDMAKQQDVWTYACVAAALLHDIGKPAVDQRITLHDHQGDRLGLWTPLTGPMPVGASYKVDFIDERRYQRHGRVAPLLAHAIVPAKAMQWLAEDPELLESWLASIQGDVEIAGALGEILSKADGLSVARNLSGRSKVRMPLARTKPLAERLLTSLRGLLSTEKLPLNRPGAAAFLDGDDLWLVSKRTLDALRESMLQEGQPEIPSRNDRLMDEWQQYGILVPNQDRAIWNCEVRIDAWSQRLTCLRIKSSLVWGDPSRRPASLSGSVIPVSADALEQEHVSTDMETTTRTTSGIKQQVSSNLSQEGFHIADRSTAPVDPEASDAAGFIDLPLPFETTEPNQTAPDADVPAPVSDTINEGDAGKRFLAWLKDNIQEERVAINTPQARLHVLQEGLALISPGIFRDFDAGHWQHVQKRFQKLRIHSRTPEDTNIWRCQVAKDRKRSTISVMLIPHPEKILGVVLPQPNPAVSLITLKGNGVS